MLGRGFGFVLGAVTLFASALLTGGRRAVAAVPDARAPAGSASSPAACRRATGRREVVAARGVRRVAGLAYGLVHEPVVLAVRARLPGVALVRARRRRRDEPRALAASLRHHLAGLRPPRAVRQLPARAGRRPARAARAAPRLPPGGVRAPSCSRLRGEPDGGRLLGTGAADGWPNPFCRCASCTSARAAGDAARPDLGAGRRHAAARLRAGGAARRAARRPRPDRAAARAAHPRAPRPLRPGVLLFRAWVPADEPLDVLGPPAASSEAATWVAPGRAGAVRRGRARATGIASARYDVRVPRRGARRRRRAVRALRRDRSRRDGCSTPPTPARCRRRDGRRRARRGATTWCCSRRRSATTPTRHRPPRPADLPRCSCAGCAGRGAVTDAHRRGRRPPRPPQPAAAASSRDRLGRLGRARARRRRAHARHAAAPRRAPRRILVLGGARSGKSRCGRGAARRTSPVTYVATALPRRRRPRVGATGPAAPGAAARALVDAGDRRPRAAARDRRRAAARRLPDAVAHPRVDAHDAWDDARAARPSRPSTARVDELVEAWRTTRRASSRSPTRSARASCRDRVGPAVPRRAGCAQRTARRGAATRCCSSSPASRNLLEDDHCQRRPRRRRRADRPRPTATARAAALQRQARLTKPAGALGRLEELSVGLRRAGPLPAAAVRAGPRVVLVRGRPRRRAVRRVGVPAPRSPRRWCATSSPAAPRSTCSPARPVPRCASSTWACPST